MRNSECGIDSGQLAVGSCDGVEGWGCAEYRGEPGGVSPAVRELESAGVLDAVFDAVLGCDWGRESIPRDPPDPPLLRGGEVFGGRRSAGAGELKVGSVESGEQVEQVRINGREFERFGDVLR